MTDIVNKINDGQKGSSALLAEEVDRVLKERKWSLSKAQIQTGVNRGTLNNMRHGIPVGAEFIAKFARAIAPPGKAEETVRKWLQLAGKDEAFLFGETQPPYDLLSLIGPTINIDPLRRVPHALGKASADPGEGFEALGETYGTLGDILPNPSRSIEVRGDCMLPYYQDGDILLVREQVSAVPGEKVIALVDGREITCKVFRMNGKPWLEPTNGEGKIEAPRFRLLGVVDALIRPEKRSTSVTYPHHRA